MNRFPFSVGSTTSVILAPITRKTAASAAVSSPAPENAPLETDADKLSYSASRPHSPVDESQQDPNTLIAQRSPSVSSSDSDTPLFQKRPKMSSSSVLVPSVEHLSLHHAPILTAGVPTPAVLLEFQDACEDFFANAKGGVADNVKVTRILPGFKDPIIRGWISSDRVHGLHSFEISFKTVGGRTSLKHSSKPPNSQPRFLNLGHETATAELHFAQYSFST